MNTLFLASQSSSRQLLLDQAGIPYITIEQSADESQCDWQQPLRAVVEAIACYKMEHVCMPLGKEGQIAFVLTADTLSFDTEGKISGKPTDIADAIAKVKAACGVNKCGTAFCLDKKVYRTGSGWALQERIVEYAEAHYEIEIPESSIEKYIVQSGALNAAGAIKIEGYGAQFVKSIRGSYTTIVGLPMFELRRALMRLGFF